MNLMMKIIEDLTPLNRVISSSDYDKSVDYLADILPFEVIEYASSEYHNGWVIPPKWDIKEAKIAKNGNTIYDGKKHALGVVALSRPIRGKVNLDELKKHLHFDDRYDDAIPFHYRQQFRSWERDWGFCVPRRVFDSLKQGIYDVVIDTEESEGILKILEFRIEGQTEETIVVGSNLDHPGVANDGLAGCVVGIELFRRLREVKTKYSYRLVLSPGILGSEYYLGKMDSTQRGRIFEGVFLEMLGSRTQLAFQHSREGMSNIESAINQAMADLSIDHCRGPFESIIINDEYIWEAYGIPMPSLSRFPYPEYHCSKDSMSIISEKALNDAVEVLMRAVQILESSKLVFKKFEGTICLSNPQYDLYADAGQVAFGDVGELERKKMRLLMDTIPCINRPFTTWSLARALGLPENVVFNYLKKWAEKGLIELK